MAAESASLHINGTPLSSIAVAITPSASTAHATATTSSSGGGPSGFFTKTGSPALVLAFLAVGIFAGGLLSLLFLRHIGLIHLIRRRQLGSAAEAELPAEPAPVSRRAKRRKQHGEKPKLWEYTHPLNRRMRDGWDAFVPLTVSPDQPVKLSLPGPESNTSPPPSSPRRRRFSAIGRWVRGLDPRPRPAPSPPQSLQPGNTGSLRLAVAVAMPAHRTSGARSRVPVYELGFMNIPWSTENFHAIDPAEEAGAPEAL